MQVCSVVQLSGFLMCLVGAARITHRAQRVVSIASRWHMALTSILSSTPDEQGFESRQALGIGSFLSSYQLEWLVSFWSNTNIITGCSDIFAAQWWGNHFVWICTRPWIAPHDLRLWNDSSAMDLKQSSCSCLISSLYSFKKELLTSHATYCFPNFNNILQSVAFWLSYPTRTFALY